MTKLNLDTFWGSSLSLAINNYNIINNFNTLYYFLTLSVFSLTDYPIFCNLIISASSKNPLFTVLASSIAAFLLDFRFKNSFKSGERILLSQLVSKLAESVQETGFKGWPTFFFLLNLLPFFTPVLLRKRFNLIPVGAWIVLTASFTLDQFIVIDLLKEITRNITLTVYWALILLITICAPLIFPRSFSNQNSLRKFYHFSAVSLFVPAAFSSLKILQIALAVASSLFLLLETLRNEANSKKLKSSALNGLNEFMEKCRNELDSGEMIFSHLYLLLGCAIPFWLNGNHLKMSSFAGVISLGVGDSLASIGGKSFGRTLWHSRTRKTIEGSLFGCMGMFASWLGYKVIQSDNISIDKLLIISIGSSLWEALIDLNDNITLPIFTFILIKNLTG